MRGALQPRARPHLHGAHAPCVCPLSLARMHYRLTESTRQGRLEEGMLDLMAARDDKQTTEHDVIDEACAEQAVVRLACLFPFVEPSLTGSRRRVTGLHRLLDPGRPSVPPLRHQAAEPRSAQLPRQGQGNCGDQLARPVHRLQRRQEARRDCRRRSTGRLRAGGRDARSPEEDQHGRRKARARSD